MEREEVAFRALCITTSSRTDYYSDTEKHTQTLEAFLDHLEALADAYTIVPATLAGAHERFRTIQRMAGD
jgi:hypothetical protein